MKFYEIDDLYIFCIIFLKCVLFQLEKFKNIVFENFEIKIIFIFLIKKSITIKKYSVWRKQISMCSAFSLINYKMQDLIFLIIILDFKNDLIIKNQDEHMKFCFLYVQLLWFQFESKFYFLQKIDMKDLQLCSHDSLLTEMKRFQKLEEKTITS